MREMRRSDRQMCREDALEVLRTAEYGVLSTTGADGQPYGTPLSFVLLDGAIYFHCARTGHKVDNMAENARVCFTAVRGTQPFSPGPGSFSTTFESAVVFGAARLVEDEGERLRALTALVRKHFPDKTGEVADAMARMGKVTAVYRIDPEAVSGKARKRD